MADIYENAFITIAATWSNDSNGGCFSRTRDLYKQQKLGDTGLYTGREMPKVPDNNSVIDDQWPLLTRQWVGSPKGKIHIRYTLIHSLSHLHVFQERLLSPRMIHYTKDQLVWECRSAQLSESRKGDWTTDHKTAENKLELHHPRIKTRCDEPVVGWQALVNAYTALQFTNNSDLIPVLAGIVEREMSRRKHDLYIAGMWKDSLVNDLGFTNYDGLRRDNNAPTWSWASLERQVFFLQVKRLPTTKITGLNFTRIGHINVGRVIHASIKLQGPILSTTTKMRIWPDEPFVQLSSLIINNSTEVQLQFYPGFDFPEMNSETPLPIIVLSQAYDNGNSTAIALRGISPGVYERVGAIELRLKREDADRRVSLAEMMRERRGILDSYIAALPLDEVEII
jgi:hypothetical protein